MTRSFSIHFAMLSKSRLHLLASFIVLAACPSLTMAQMAGDNHRDPSPTITFTVDFPSSNPEHYTISLHRSGQGHYESLATDSPDSTPQSYTSDFEVSPEGREQIFECAKRAGYFAGKLDSGNRKLAFTGTKTVTYHDGTTDNTAQYDYSSLPAIRELTAHFQGMAATLEYGRRLDYYHRYQKLALDGELKSMITQARNNELNEIGSVAPVLREIMNDSSVINLVRVRARDLIEMGNGTTAHK